MRQNGISKFAAIIYIELLYLCKELNCLLEMKLLLSVFVFCLLFISCGNGNKIKIPKDVICQDSMVEVITDVHLVQASQRMGIRMDSTDTGRFTSFNYVWKKHHITEAEYKKSLDFYTHNASILDSIYENVLNNLSRQKAELLAQKHLK